MKLPTFYLNPKTNKQGLYTLLQSLDINSLWRIRIDEFDQKTRDQEEKYHAMLGDIAKQSKHLNQVLGLEDWKRLCVAQYAQDCIDNDIPRLNEYWSKNKFTLMPSLDGRSLVTLGSQTRDFPKYVASGFIEWLMAYGVENNINWTDTRYHHEIKQTDYNKV
jgi:hypothetical protein